jgi:uncharacterized protein (DUF983 family)
MGLKGVCPKCGVTYYGWALENPNNQRCDDCDCNLAITKDGMVQNQKNSIKTTKNERKENK